jgi:hypothetical protein
MNNRNKTVQEGEEYEERFKEGVERLSKMYKRFPDNLLNMMVEEQLIPLNEGELLIRKFVQLGMLLPLKNNYFKIKILSR